MKKILFTACVLVLYAPCSWGQSAIVATGGNISGSGGTASYSVGQLSYNTRIGNNGTVSEGVQQPFEIYTTGIDKYPGITLSVKAYPNPVTSKLHLVVADYGNEEVFYALNDISGRLLQERQIHSGTAEISMDNYPGATYIISIINKDNNVLKTFKIIKQ